MGQDTVDGVAFEDLERDHAEAIESFEAVAQPAELEKVEEVSGAVRARLEQAQQIEVRTAEDAAAATTFLSQIAGEKKRAEEARVFLTKPLLDHKKAIDARFKAPAEMLAQADAIVRERVVAFRAAEEEARAAEQARLDAEHAAREAELRAEREREEAEARAVREAAAREAAEAEAAAQRAEAERRAQMDAEAGELAAKVAAMEQADLEFAATNPRVPEKIQSAAKAELDARTQAREAQERAAAARQAEEDARRAEEEARARPVEMVPAVRVAPAAKLAGATERKRWVATVVDAQLVPREWLIVNEKAINAAVKAGLREIPGVTIEAVAEIAVRAS